MKLIYYLNPISFFPGSIDSEEQEEAVGRYFEYLTEDNPLKFGVSSEVLEEFIQTARDSTKAMLS